MSDRRIATPPAPGAGAGQRRPWWRSRWWMPAFALALGLVVLAAFAVGDDAGAGVKAFAVMAVVALAFAVGTRQRDAPGPRRTRPR